MQSVRDEVIVMTSAICPSPGVFRLTITDPKRRLLETYCSLISWFISSGARRMVLCDNTNPQKVFSPVCALADKLDVDFETLLFKGDVNATLRYGKGYGEGEILAHVMAESSLLRSSPRFYKITGRQFVRNFDAIRKRHANDDVVFQKHKNLRMIHTRFYKCSVLEYEATFKDCYKRVRDRDGVYTEHLFRRALGLRGFSTFAERPQLVGYSGTSGQLFDGYDYSPAVKAQAEALMLGITIGSS